MGSPSIPAQPPPPDYAAANREGIYTDIETLPIRNLINQAAQLGQRVEYFDPATRTTKVADFTGMGNAAAAEQAAKILADTNAAMQRQQTALREELGVTNAQQTAREIEAADPLAYQVRQRLTGSLLDQSYLPPEVIDPSKDIAAAAGRMSDLGYSAPQYDGRRLGSIYDAATRLDTGTADVGAQGTLRDVMGMTTSNQAAGAGMIGSLMSGLRGQDGSRTLGNLSNQLAETGAMSRARLGELFDVAGALPTDFVDYNAAALNPALAGALQDYALGGKLNEAELRDVTNRVRAGQAARGNYLGDAAQVAEAIEQMAVSDARKQQRLQNLLNIQGQVFGQGDSLRQQSQAAKLARLGALQGLQGQEFGQDSERAAQLAALEGQRFGQVGANADRMAGLEGQRFNQAAASNASLASLAQQLFGNEAAMRGETRGAQMAQLGLLSNLAGQDFGQQQQAFNTQLAGAGAALNAAGMKAANQQQARQETFGRGQQRLANASAMVLGQPITNQFGALGAAQQGAVGFTPVSYQPTGQLNQNAGAQAANFAQGNYGNLANMWGTQANIAAQGNPWMSMVGTVGGAALGALI